MVIVSVCMITYNHEDFIIQALESVLSQKCNFEIEVVLSNDCSTDLTHHKIINFLKDHRLKNNVKYINQLNNLGITLNFALTLNQCIGKYIAICEGDDYWTDSLKLQKQVDFLELHKDFSGIATNSLVKYEGLQKEHLFKTNIKPILITNDLLEARHFHTATFIFRKEAFKDDFPNNVLSADRTLFLLVSCFGKIGVLEDVTAVYRKNDGGISRKVTSKQMKQDYRIVDYIKRYNEEFNHHKLKSFISKTILDYSFKIHFIDFIKASFFLIFFECKQVYGFRNKLKSIKQSFKIINDKKGKLVI